LLANTERLMLKQKKTYRDYYQENCEDEVLILKDITRTYPNLQLFEKKSLNSKHDNDPFDYVHNFEFFTCNFYCFILIYFLAQLWSKSNA